MIKLAFLLSLLVLLSACNSKNTGSHIAVEVSKQQHSHVNRRQAVKIMLESVYFEFGKFELSSEAKNILSKNAEILKKAEAKKIIVIGCCDSRGSEKHNKILARQRAGAVKEFYAMFGIDSKLISIHINLARDDGSLDEISHAKNRRTDTVMKDILNIEK